MRSVINPTDIHWARVKRLRHQNHIEAARKIIVTIINQKEPRRRLYDLESLIKATRVKLKHARIQLVDFATISFHEQIETIRLTNMLIGAHGAGLAHGMWLRPESAMAKILPYGVNHKGFRNLAGMLNRGYFSAHAQRRNESGDWHDDDLYIEEEKFAELVEMAVKSIYNKGSRSFDVV